MNCPPSAKKGGICHGTPRFVFRKCQPEKVGIWSGGYHSNPCKGTLNYFDPGSINPSHYQPPKRGPQLVKIPSGGDVFQSGTAGSQELDSKKSCDFLQPSLRCPVECHGEKKDRHPFGFGWLSAKRNWNPCPNKSWKKGGIHRATGPSLLDLI